MPSPVDRVLRSSGSSLSAVDHEVNGLTSYLSESECHEPTRPDPATAMMWIGALEFDLLLGDVHSLKEKRSVVRPLIADVRKRFELSVAEVDHLDLHRRAGIGVAAVSPDRAHLIELLDAAERLVAYRPELELLSVRRTLRSSDD
jgi:uncharacterized protein YlxP (DUF503 family)